MARGKSEKLLAALPADYSADWLERFDKRTKVWRAATEREQALVSDAGGAENLSRAKRSLIRRAVFLELLAETQEMKFAGGEPLDIGAYTQAFNSMLGAYRVLGLERRARSVERLRDVMRGEAESEPKPEPDRGAVTDSEAQAAHDEMIRAGAAPADVQNSAPTNSGNTEPSADAPAPEQPA